MHTSWDSNKAHGELDLSALCANSHMSAGLSTDAGLAGMLM